MFERFSDMHSHLVDMERVPVIVLAYLITVVVGMIIGPFRGNANPFMWEMFDLLFGKTGDRLNRSNRSAKDLMTRGLLFSVILTVSCFVAVEKIDSYVLSQTHLMWHALALSLFITSGAVWFSVLRVFFALDKDDVLKGAYMSLARSGRVDLNSTDTFGVTREGVSFLAVSFDKGMIAPALWYLIGGFPLLAIYAAVSFLSWRYGQFGLTRGFGRVALALEKVMGYVPSLLSGLLFYCAAAVTPTAKIKTAFMQWWKNRDAYPYEQHGGILAAIAWPLHISLGGPIQDLSGVMYKRGWIGPEGASAQLERDHLKRALFLHVIANILFLASLLVAYVYAAKFV